MESGFKWLIATIIAFLAAGGGIVALLNYFHPTPAQQTAGRDSHGRRDRDTGRTPSGGAVADKATTEKASNGTASTDKPLGDQAGEAGGGAAGKKVAVPDVVGQRDPMARDRLRAAGLDAHQRFESSASAPCTVVNTEPPAGTQVARGSSVTVTFSQGQHPKPGFSCSAENAAPENPRHTM